MTGESNSSIPSPEYVRVAKLKPGLDLLNTDSHAEELMPLLRSALTKLPRMGVVLFDLTQISFDYVFYQPFADMAYGELTKELDKDAHHYLVIFADVRREESMEIAVDHALQVKYADEVDELSALPANESPEDKKLRSDRVKTLREELDEYNSRVSTAALLFKADGSCNPLYLGVKCAPGVPGSYRGIKSDDRATLDDKVLHMLWRKRLLYTDTTSRLRDCPDVLDVVLQHGWDKYQRKER